MDARFSHGRLKDSLSKAMRPAHCASRRGATVESPRKNNCAGIKVLANVIFSGTYANTHIMDYFKEIDMATQAIRFTVASTVVLIATILASPFAYAQVSDGRDKPTAVANAKCGCPSDGRDKPSAVTGLGESLPKTSDLSSDPQWQVYEFERDGIRYLQINDGANTARAAIGQIGATAWVLPIGRDADHVAIQAGASAAVAGRVVYRDETVEVIYYRQLRQDRWIIRPTESSH